MTQLAQVEVFNTTEIRCKRIIQPSLAGHVNTTNDLKPVRTTHKSSHLLIYHDSFDVY